MRFLKQQSLLFFKMQIYIEFREMGKYPEPGNFSFVDWHGCQSGGFTLQFHFQLPLKDLEIHVYDAYVERSICSRNVPGIPLETSCFLLFWAVATGCGISAPLRSVLWTVVLKTPRILQWTNFVWQLPVQFCCNLNQEAHWTNLDLARGR